MRGLLCSPAVPPGLSMRKCGVSGSASGQTVCPVCPTLRQSRSCHSNASPLHRGCLSLPLLPVWMNVSFLSTWCWTSLPFDFLSVLVVQGGVSTYASILVLRDLVLIRLLGTGLFLSGLPGNSATSSGAALSNLAAHMWILPSQGIFNLGAPGFVGSNCAFTNIAICSVNAHFPCTVSL